MENSSGKHQRLAEMREAELVNMPSVRLERNDVHLEANGRKPSEVGRKTNLNGRKPSPSGRKTNLNGRKPIINSRKN